MKPWVLALAGMVVVIVAFVADLVFSWMPAIRNGAWTFIPLGIGLALVVSSIARRRSWATIVPAVIAILGIALHGFMRWMPAPSDAPAVQVGDPFPNVSLPDHENRAVQLSDHWTNGPLVVVLFRGTW